MSLTCFGQDSLSIDTRQTNGVDSIHASHTTFSSNTLEDATKAEGDSAYIKEDYAAAIQIYEALLKNGEAADVYYNLGNSYYKIGEIAKAVLNAVGFIPNNQLEDLLDEKYDEVAVIGDAVAPRKILTAIHEGYHAIRVME